MSTFAAVMTGQGVGAISTIQLVGDSAKTVIKKIFKPVTAKPTESRMGKGKGAPSKWVAVVKPGRVLYEIAGVSEEDAREAMRLASHKLPMKSRFITRESGR